MPLGTRSILQLSTPAPDQAIQDRLLLFCLLCYLVVNQDEYIGPRHSY